MVEQKLCSFCGGSIEPGTGRIYVRKDGVAYNFCSNKCFRNMTVLKRVPRDTRWTAQYVRDKEVRLAAETHADKEGIKKKGSKKVRRVVKAKKPEKKQPAENKEPAEKKPEEKKQDAPKKEAAPAKKEKGDES